MIDLQLALERVLAWIKANGRRLKIWGLWILGIALALSLVRFQWDGEGMAFTLAPTTFTIFIVLLVVSPVLIAVLLIAGGKIKAGGVEVSVESLFKLVDDKQVKDELLGLLGSQAEIAVAKGSGEEADMGRRMRDALDNVAQELESGEGVEDKLAHLAQEYVEARKLPDRAQRLRASAAVQSKVRGATRGVPLSTQRVIELLGSPDDGQRIIGVTIASQQDDPVYFAGVLDQIEHSKSAYEQYHALRAAEDLISRLDGAQKASLRQALKFQREDKSGWLTTTGDRQALADRMLDKLGP